MDKISYVLAVLARVAIIVLFSLHGGIMLAASYWIAIGQGRPGINRWLSIPVGIIGLGLVRIAYWVYAGKFDAVRQRINDWGLRKLGVRIG